MFRTQNFIPNISAPSNGPYTVFRPLCDDIGRLQDEIDELREENTQLKELLAGDKYAPPCFIIKLSPYERHLLGILMQRGGGASYEYILQALSLLGFLETTKNSLAAKLVSLRWKLKPHDVSILTDWGAGLYIEKESRERLNELSRPRGATGAASQ